MTAVLDPPIGPRLLHQASIWRAYDDTGQLRTVFLEEMTPAHRTRVLALLRDKAPDLLAMEKRSVSRLHFQHEICLDQYVEAMAALEATTPAVWIEEQPITRRLRQLGARPATLRKRGLLRRWRR